MTEKKYNILYLDDEESNLRIFRAAFKQYYKIFLAKSGQEGLDILRENDIQLIITDQRMPKMTGVEFLEKIIPDYPDTIRIILTGFSDIEDIIRALNKCSIYRYIVKPWNREEMKLTIDKALETWQLRFDNMRLMDELKDINNSLEEKIVQRTSELTKINELLKEAKERAEEAFKTKENFLSTMSHEIRTPLNAIIGVAHLLKQSTLNHEQADNVQILEFSAKNLLALINDILDLSKIESGKVDLEKSEFNLRQLLYGIFRTMLPKAQEKGLALIENYGNDIPDVIACDQYRINQILTNLVGNALKFTEQGSVTLSVNLLQDHGEAVTLRFAVTDTGIGIPSDMFEKIFEDFSQASTDTTRKFGGTGLGLAITKKLVELYHSKIVLTSEVGKGSTFSFDLHVHKGKPVKETERAAGTPVASVKDLEGIRILVVEDNAFNQAIARKFLTSWNAEVAIANDGFQALDVLSKDRSFKIILMDIQMPDMDGYEATQRIRKLPQPYYQEIPIIALSASTLSGEKERALTAGMNDYMMKPFDPEVLYSKLIFHLQGQVAAPVAARPKEIKVLETADITFDRFQRMAENDDDFYAELLDIAIEDYELFKKEFEEAAIACNEEIMGEICHKIRPSMIVLGMESLYNEMSAFREMAYGDYPERKEKLTVILAQVQLIIEAIGGEIERLKAR
jgi:signal transduction histidine kinase